MALIEHADRQESVLATLWAKAPHNVEAEWAILGAAMFEPDMVAEIEGLRPEHFWEPLHARIWQAFTTLVGAGKLAEPIALADILGADAAFQEFGGLGYLADLVDRAPPASRAQGYATIISDLAMRRELIKLAARTATDAADLSEGHSADALVVEVERAAATIAKGSTGADDWMAATDVVRRAVANALQRDGTVQLSTGLKGLDMVTGGFRRGEMAIIAGRPAMGKSTAGLAMARAFAERGQGVCFFSMEMAETPLGLRMACDVAFDQYDTESQISYFAADRGQLQHHQWQALQEAGHRMANWPLAFDTRPGHTTTQMEAKARRQFRKWAAKGIDAGAIVVDHLTIAGVENARSGNKVAEVGDISRGLAEMAKRLDVPVIALCQLSRDVEKREGKEKRPNLADLRWSGEIEQDARLVMFLHRPEYYLKKPLDSRDTEAMLAYQDKLSDVRHRLNWLVEKNNSGPTGEVETYCNVACSAIRDGAGA